MDIPRSSLWTATQILGIPIAGVVDATGIFGNVALFIVLFRSARKTSLYFIIETLSLIDSFTLVHNLIFQVLPLAYELSEAFEGIYGALSPVIPAVWPVAMSSHMASVWLTVLISAERWIAVCKPFYRQRLVTLRRTQIAVYSILVVSLAFNAPRLFEYRNLDNDTDSEWAEFANETETGWQVGEESNSSSFSLVVGELYWQKSELGRSGVYAYGYGVVMYALFVFLLPFVLITFSNFHIISELRSAQRTLCQLSKVQQHEQRMTLMPVYIAALFCIFETPAFLINIADATGAIAYAGWQLALVCSTLLVMINGATNFIIYCVCTRHVRTSIKYALCCMPTAKRETNVNASQHVAQLGHNGRRQHRSAASVIRQGTVSAAELRKFSVSIL